jgi:hypothetical protein
VVVNLRPDADVETEFVGFDRPRVVRVLERIAADLDNLSLVPNVRRDRIDFLKPGFEESDALGAPLIEATGNGEPQFVFALPRCEYFRRQEKIIESPELPEPTEEPF